MLSEEEIKAFDLMKTPLDKDYGYILVVKMYCPDHLHDAHSDYPLAPEKCVVTHEMLSKSQHDMLHALGDKKDEQNYHGTAKLVTDLNVKDRYVVHAVNLRLYIELGMIVEDIYEVLRFRQSCWLKPYIDFNTSQRALATNEFDRNQFKLFNNSMFGKLMENLRKRRDVNLVTNIKRLEKLVAKPTFKSFTIFNENLVAIENYQSSIILNKPIYVGFCVLELSKWLMYTFHYRYIKRRYPGPLSTLLFTDTDSLTYRIRTNDIYKDMLDDANEPKWNTYEVTDAIFYGKSNDEIAELQSRIVDWFDWSGYPISHRVFKGMSAETIDELRQRNKKVIGKMKDELDGCRMIEMVGLSSKVYTFLVHDEDQLEFFATKSRSTKKLKGISTHVVKNNIQHVDYRKCLFESKSMYREMKTFRSYNHIIYTQSQVKRALANFDDKRYILDDGITTLPHGHYSLR